MLWGLRRSKTFGFFLRGDRYKKLLAPKNNSSEQKPAFSTSLNLIRNKVKIQSAPPKQLEPNDSIDISDD